MLFRSNGFFKNESKSGGMVDTMIKSPFLCNSDKFSLVFSLMQMPQNYRDMMSESLKMETEQIEEIKKSELLHNKSAKGDVISNQYIQDIYRFFKLFSRNKDFNDPFKIQFDFSKLFFISNIDSSKNFLRELGEVYFVKDYFNEACYIFESLIDENKLDVELYQKIGYCYQMNLDFKKALSFYEKANLISNSLWTLKKIAYCYKSLKDTNEALNTYLEIEKLAPNDLGVQLNIGNCYLEKKKYDEALKEIGRAHV